MHDLIENVVTPVIQMLKIEAAQKSLRITLDIEDLDDNLVMIDKLRT